MLKIIRTVLFPIWETYAEFVGIKSKPFHLIKIIDATSSPIDIDNEIPKQKTA